MESDAPYDSRQREQLRIGVHTLPRFSRDATDRNRTSPFAFTGNRFEFRMPGSAASISCANTVLNTTVADELKAFADALEGAENFTVSLHALLRKVIHDHKRIIFNGDGYDSNWPEEASRRSLLNLRTTPDALPHILDEKNVRLFERHRVYSKTELEARYEVLSESYCKVINIEACTMLDMAKRDILPAMSRHSAHLARAVLDRGSVSPEATCLYERDSLRRLSAAMDAAYRQTAKLEQDLLDAKAEKDVHRLGCLYRDVILPDMAELRVYVDEMETLSPSAEWPYPSYGELLFSVR